jgi:uncharacterized protein YoxC
MIIEICVALATVAFIVLVVFLVRTLIKLNKTLDHTNGVVNRLETKIEPLQSESVKLLANVNNLTQTVSDHLDAFNPLMDSVHEVGAALQDVSHNFSEKITKASFEGEREQTTQWEDKALKILELGALAIGAYQQIKKKRR